MELAGANPKEYGTRIAGLLYKIFISQEFIENFKIKIHIFSLCHISNVKSSQNEIYRKWFIHQRQKKRKDENLFFF